ALGQRLDRLSNDDDALVADTDLFAQRAQDAVVLEQMSHRGDVTEVVEGDDLDVVIAGLHGTEKVTADTAEAVDPYANRHCSTLLGVRPGNRPGWHFMGSQDTLACLHATTRV